MATETRHVDSGRARLAVTTWGDAGTPMVALHPGVGDSRIWQWCAPAWAEAGHRVIAYDRRGFGATEYEPEPHDDLGDLLAVTDAVDARPAVVVGNSQGGSLAIDLALAHPGHVSALILISPSPSGYDYDNWPLMEAEDELDDQLAAAEEAGDLELVNRIEVRYWLDGVAQAEGRVDGPPRALMAEMNATALRAPPPGEPAERPPAWPRLVELAMPVLVLAGEHDLDGTQRQGREIADAVTDGRFVTIGDAAHCPMLDQPEQLNEFVLEFLSRL